MIRGEPLFVPVFFASLLVHVLAFVIISMVPGGSSSDSVKIYRIEIVEAPSRPQAKALRFSTAAISALNLEAPSLGTVLPDAPLTAPSPAAPPQAPSASAAQAPSLPLPPLPEHPAGRLQKPPAPPPLPPARLPQPPQSAMPGAPAAAESGAAPPPEAPPALPGSLLGEQTPMEALREKVQRLTLRLEPAPGNGETRQGDASKRRNPLALRRYQARIQDEVKRNYTFPGEFSATLTTRVLVVIARDGSKLKLEIIQSSGNERFDYAVLLTLRGTRFPPLPDGIPGESLAQTFLFSPN